MEEQGAKVVQAEINDDASMHAALKGAYCIFYMTAVLWGAQDKEFDQGKRVADIAVAQGLKYIIFSTLPNVTKISGGKCTKVKAFGVKAEIEEYICTLPIQSAFSSPASFMQTWNGMMKPAAAEDGTYYITRHMKLQMQLPLIDISGDTGKWVGAGPGSP